MLVLSRQRDETIMIGDEIEISVVDIRGDKVRLGITAPTKIAVHRKEVYEAIRSENAQAARIGEGDMASLDRLRPGPAKRSAEARRKTVGLATPSTPSRQTPSRQSPPNQNGATPAPAPTQINPPGNAHKDTA